MTEIVTEKPVNVSQLGYELGGAALRKVGPYPDDYMHAELEAATQEADRLTAAFVDAPPADGDEGQDTTPVNAAVEEVRRLTGLVALAGRTKIKAEDLDEDVLAKAIDAHVADDTWVDPNAVPYVAPEDVRAAAIDALPDPTEDLAGFKAGLKDLLV